MVILHIASINNEKTAGVAVVVPQHIEAQAAKEIVAFVNVTNVRIDTVENQLEYCSDFSLEQLEPPFNKPDLVVFHNAYCVEYLKIARNLVKNRVPYIIVPHGALTEIAQRKKRWKKIIGNKVFFDDFFDKATAIQFLSKREKDCSRYQNKGFIGTNGIKIPDEVATPKYRDIIKMVYIGRTEVHIKGLDMLLAAVNDNRSLFEVHKIHLDLFGPDCQREHKKIRSLIAKYGIEKYVSLHDAVVGKEKERVLLDTDIFIQTSRTEGMPMGILEALSYGIPCLITKGTALGDFVNGRAGWVAETSTDGVAKAMIVALEERTTWNIKSVQARKLISDHYAWEKAVTDTLEEYKKIVWMRGKTCL